MVEIVPYAEWSTRPRGATASSHPIGTTRGVTLHWEGPHMGEFTHASCAGKVRGIQAFHRDSRGWADIAYNAVVCPHGSVFEGRGPNVTSAANGDTASNAAWYAVCYLGGVGDPLTADGKLGMFSAVLWLRKAGQAGPEVNGHRDHKATACPGDEIYQWLNRVDWTVEEEDDMPYTAKQLSEIVRRAVAAEVDPLKEQVTEIEAALQALRKGERERYRDLRRVLRERFGATDAQLDEILGPEPSGDDE